MKMKRGLMFLFVAVLLMSSFVFVSAQEDNIEKEPRLISAQENTSEKGISFNEVKDKAGTTPGQAFYFMDRAFDAFKSSEKLADERAYELAVLANKSAEGEKVKNRTMERARGRYDKVMEKVQKRAQKREHVAERVANSTTKHLEVLSMVHEKVPEQAKGAIEKTMNNSMKGRENALNALGQFNQSKADKMQEMTNKRIQNRVSEEVRNRVQEMAGVSLGPGLGHGEAGQGTGESGAGQGMAPKKPSQGNDTGNGQGDMNTTPSGSTQNTSGTGSGQGM